MNPLGLFLARTRSERGLFLEALLHLTWAKLLVRLVPFRWLARRLGAPQSETPLVISAAERAVALDISWAVQAAARHVPLGFVCLPQAMAAKAMLRRRGLPSTLYLGVAADPQNIESITAHAWLRTGDKIVTGERESLTHRTLAMFGDSPPSG